MSSITSEAILFFDDGSIVKEMLYMEFEALLDQVVGVEEFKHQSVPAAYVRINAQLGIEAVVLFLVEFDDAGYLDSQWNLPLQHLADNAGTGPDLGAGPIKLACLSQCSVSWHQRSLWDPVLSEKSHQDTYQKLVHAVNRNRLGLVTKHESVPVLKTDQRIDPEYDALIEDTAAGNDINDLRVEVKELKKANQLRLAKMKAEAAAHIEKLRNHYREEIKNLSSTSQSTKQLLADEKRKNTQLKSELDNQAEKFSELRKTAAYQESVEHKITAEVDAKVATATAELKETLSMRDVELFYRDDQIRRLQEEVLQLQQDKQAWLSDGDNGLLKNMVEQGINFVTCPPGLDQTAVSSDDLAEYLRSPEEYVAKANRVDPEIYQQWLAHYNQPLCQHRHAQGKTCNAPLPKIETPTLFITGFSDCCAHHQAILEDEIHDDMYEHVDCNKAI